MPSAAGPTVPDRTPDAGGDVDGAGQCGQLRHRDQARFGLVHALDPMRTDTAGADPARRVQRPPHPGPPAEPVVGQRLHRDVELESGQPAELLGDDGGLELPLQRGIGVLEVAAATAAGVEVRARRLHPTGIGAQHPDHLAAAERTALRLGDPHRRPLPRQCEPDEDHPAVIPGHAVSAVGDRADVDLDLDAGSQFVTGQRAGHRVTAWPVTLRPVGHGSSRDRGRHPRRSSCRASGRGPTATGPRVAGSVPPAPRRTTTATAPRSPSPRG